MSDDEIVKQNRDTLLERMNESGNAYSDEYPYGLMGEAEEEIKLLRMERDEAIFWRDIARRMVCDLKVADEWGFSARYLAKEFAEVQGWDCFKEETQ